MTSQKPCIADKSSKYKHDIVVDVTYNHSDRILRSDVIEHLHVAAEHSQDSVHVQLPSQRVHGVASIPELICARDDRVGRAIHEPVGSDQ